MPRRLEGAAPTKSLQPNVPGRPPKLITANSEDSAIGDWRGLIPQQPCASACLPVDTDSRASAPANLARVPEAGADSIPTTPQERPPRMQETELKLCRPKSYLVSSIESHYAFEYHETGSYDLLRSSMPTRGDPYFEGEHWEGVSIARPDGGPRPIKSHTRRLGTTSAYQTVNQTTANGLCPSPRETSPTVTQDVEHGDLEKSAPGDDLVANTEVCPVRKRAWWDLDLCRPLTVSERPPKRLVLALLGASTAGAVLMAQWRLGDPHKQPDHPRSRTAQHGFVSHPGVLVLGISLHIAALTLVYHLNGFDRRQDVFLILTTGATATVASLLGLEASTILLRATPWASIVALCASIYSKGG